MNRFSFVAPLFQLVRRAESHRWAEEPSRKGAKQKRFAGLLADFAPVRRLTGKQEGFDELAFAAYDEAGKFPEPLAFRNVRLGVQPARQQDDLLRRDVSLTHSRQKMC